MKLRIKSLALVLNLSVVLVASLVSCGSNQGENSDDKRSQPINQELVTSVENGEGGLSSYEVSGVYEIEMKSKTGHTSQFTYLFESTIKGDLELQNGALYEYDQATSTARFSFDTDEGTNTSTFIFTSENDTIHLRGTVEKNDEIIMNYEGYRKPDLKK